ncbi:DUF2911 domain-containing protein [uncultured Psychroserpens sp.]|uniref:DUF2911 domain-containing protein n=1 Tax=uncultured Psychroserpens sp. TaxID=255436 RepID=UPI0026083B03|nr:DUF2911 domain-containing protein [uncultured Psychroserpens sp.]
MKKTAAISTLFMAFMMLVSFNMNAQKFPGLDKSPLDIAYYKTSRSAPPIAKIVYSRPQLKGRSLASLAPDGKVWRTGANETTEITFYSDVNFGGKSVKAGTYSLFTIPGEKNWTVILNSDLYTWGAYSYNEGKDVARIEVPVTSGKDSLEAFSIAFSKGSLNLGWDTLRIAIPLSK